MKSRRRIYDLRFTIYEQKGFTRVNRKSHILNLIRWDRPAAFDEAGGNIAGVFKDSFGSAENFSGERNCNQVGGGVRGKFADFSGEAEGARAVDGGHFQN